MLERMVFPPTFSSPLSSHTWGLSLNSTRRHHLYSTAMISNMNGELCLVLGRCASKSGQISKAEAHFAIVAVDASMPKLTKALNATFVVSACGDWVTAGQGLAQACRGGWYELCCVFHHSLSHLFWRMLLTEARMKLCMFCGPICTWDKLPPHGYIFTLMQVMQLTAGHIPLPCNWLHCNMSDKSRIVVENQKKAHEKYICFIKVTEKHMKSRGHGFSKAKCFF